MAAFTETIERRNPALTATGLAIWGWILRIVVCVAFFILPHVVTAMNKLVEAPAVLAQVQAAGANPPPALLAEVAKIKTAAADGPHQWQTWWWICIVAEILFLGLMLPLIGRWSPKAAKADEYLGLAQRTQADFENYRKRSAREAAVATQRGATKLAKELLPAVDNLERALEQRDVVVLAEHLGIGAHRAVAGDLVMLHPLRAGDQAGVDHRRLPLHLGHLRALLEQALHPLAGMSLGALVEVLEDLLEAADMLLGLPQMIVEPLPQVRGMGRLGHLRQRLDDLRLGGVEVLELFEVEILEGFELHGVPPC